jgi:cellobiose phosphorylase
MRSLFEAELQRGATMHETDRLGWDNHVTINSDPQLWPAWAASFLVRETGDLSHLETRHAFRDGGEASAYEHMKRALEFTLDHSGLHGLPLIRSGDWNDCLNGPHERGVSVWLAEFLYICLMEVAEMARRTGRDGDSIRYAAEAERLKRTINEKCWDGRWYVRAFDDDGAPIGSASDDEGRIWVNAQTWAVIGGIAPPERALESLKAVEGLMDTPVGIPMLAPPYTRVGRAGLISRMAPGCHHNGGVWNHAVTWAIIAECMTGRPGRALDIYRRIFPPKLSNEYDLHVSEPYCHTSYTNAPLSGELGATGVGWNTGTIGWVHRATYEGFAGLHAGWDGLVVDPSLPSDWREVKVTRRYRRNVFEIAIDNPEGRERGVASIEVEGEPRDSNLIPAVEGDARRRVRVVMGENRVKRASVVPPVGTALSVS